MNNKGQTLILLLIFMAIVVTLTTAAVGMSVVNSVGNTRHQQSNLAYDVAESGIENALLRLLRDPNYTGEANLPVGTGTVTTTVTSSPTTITATGQVGNYIRKIQVVATFGDTLTIQSWKEIQ